MTTNNYFNPFPGLRSFEEEEEYLFFGREQQVDNLLDKIESTHFLAVVGASGSGKSSLVKCGLLPSFHSGFLKGVGNGWRIGVFRPGDNPIGNMADCFCGEELIGSVHEEKSESVRPIVESILRRSDEGIENVVDQFLASTEENLLIVVDQFEELFRFSKYEKKSNKGARDSLTFINLLLKAIKNKSNRVYIVITMRSDFLGNCTEFRGLPEAINEGQYLIPRMTRNEKKLAITGPVAVGGGSISPQLVSLLLNEVGDNPDQLPIMQHALMRTWDFWMNNSENDKPIDVHHYQAIGKMANALSYHADEAFNGLKSEKDREVCSRLFKSLTEIGTSAGGVRRPTKLNELQKLLDVPIELVIEIVDVFRQKGRSFLMPPDNVALEENTVIDISHESLMRVWKRLNTWVKEEADSAKAYKAIALAAKLYQEGKGGYYRNPELQVALQWKNKTKPTEDWAIRYDFSFVRAMTFLDQSKEEFDFELALKEMEQHKKIRRNKIATIILSSFLVVVILFSILVFLKGQQAVTARLEAEVAKDEAIDAKDEALTEKERADAAAIEAELQRKKAVENENEANTAKDHAEKESLRAQRSEEEAMRSAASEKIQRVRADSLKALAEGATEEARSKKDTADFFKNQALAKNMAYESINLLNQNKAIKGEKLAMQAYYLNRDNIGPNQVNDIYVALLRSLYSGDSSHYNSIGNYKYEVKDVAVNPLNGMVVSVNEIGTVTLAKMINNFELNELSHFELNEEARSVAFSPDGNYLAIGTFDGNVIIFNKSKKQGNRLNRRAGYRTNGIVMQLKWATLQEKQYLFVETSKETVLFEENKGSLNKVNISFSDLYPKNIQVISNNIVYSINNKLVFGKLVQNTDRSFKIEKIKDINFGASITAVSSLSGSNKTAVGLKDGNVYLVENGNNSWSKSKLLKHQSQVSDLALFKNKGLVYIATTSFDKAINITSLNAIEKDDEEIITIKGNYAHSSWIYKVVPSADGDYLFSASKDGNIKMWFTNASEIANNLND